MKPTHVVGENKCKQTPTTTKQKTLETYLSIKGTRQSRKFKKVCITINVINKISDFLLGIIIQ